jgi:hypothetical protein
MSAPKKKRNREDRRRSKFYAAKIDELLTGKKPGRGAHNKGKKWGKPLVKGDPRIKKAHQTLKEAAAQGRHSGRITNELRYKLLREFIEEQPLVKARMRMPVTRPADHVKYLDLLGKYSHLGTTITIKTDEAAAAPGKLTKEQIMAELQSLLDTPEG